MNEKRDMSHILEFVDQSKQMLIDYGECCLVAATGWGKSAATASILKYFNEDALVICPSHSIKDQWIKSVMEMSGVYNMSLLTYQYFARHYSELVNKFKIIVFDEAHHMGGPVWGEAIRKFRDLSTNNPYIFGLTAETFRQSDGTDVAETVFHNHIVSAHNYEESIKEGILPPATYVYAMFDTAGIEEEFAIKDTDSDAIRDLKGRLTYTLQNRTKISDILKKHAPKGCKGIIFVDDISSIPIGFNLAIEAFPNKPIRFIHSGLPRDEVDHTLEDFRKMKSGFIIAIDMLNEGVHVEGVNTVVMLRKTWSRRIYKQQIGRALSPKSKNVTIFDFVANYVSVAEAAQHIADFGNFEGDGEGKGFNPKYSRQSIIHDYVSDILSILEEINSTISINNRWTPEEDKVLIDNYSFSGSKCFELLPNRSVDGCYSRVRFLGLCYESPTAFTKEEDEIIKKYYPKLGSDIVQLLEGRSLPQCKNRAYKLGLNVDVNVWTQEEDDIIIKYYPDMGSSVSSMLNDRSPNACISRAVKLNVKYKHNSEKWSDEEDEILRQLYPSLGAKVLEYLPNRTLVSLRFRASKLKLKYANPDWSESEDNIIIEYYPKIGKKVVDMLPGRSELACINRAKGLGVKSYTQKWSPEEDRILRDNYDKMKKDVYKLFDNRSKKSCIKRLRTLGIID